MNSTKATSILICWEAPNEANSPIFFYTINARDIDGGNGVIMRNTSTNATFFNVTGLLPGTTYELTVVAVFQVGIIPAVSEVSAPQNGITEITGWYHAIIIKFLQSISELIDIKICLHSSCPHMYKPRVYQWYHLSHVVVHPHWRAPFNQSVSSVSI